MLPGSPTEQHLLPEQQMSVSIGMASFTCKVVSAQKHTSVFAKEKTANDTPMLQVKLSSLTDEDLLGLARAITFVGKLIKVLPSTLPQVCLSCAPSGTVCLRNMNLALGLRTFILVVQ